MLRILARQNVERFERMLRSEREGPKRARLEGLLAEARHELDGLAGIWSWTCPHLDIPSAVGVAAEKLLDDIVQAQGANFGSLQIWDDTQRGLFLIAHSNFDRSSAAQFASVRDGDGTACEAAHASQAPVIIEDIEKAEAFASLRAWTRAIGIRAIRTTPVFARSGRFIGAFSTHYASPRAFSNSENEINSVHVAGFSSLFADLHRA